MRKIICVAHDIRSTHNIGSLFRTCEGLGIDKLILSGYTPYPIIPGDIRLPHESLKLQKQIDKTALGATQTLNFEHSLNINKTIAALKSNGYQIVALEQAPNSVKLPEFVPNERIALILGREVEGIDPTLLKLCDITVEIPMFGQKESFNVTQAAAIALYHLRFSK